MTLLVTLAIAWVVLSFGLGAAWAALRYATHRPYVGDRLPGPRSAADDAASAVVRTPAAH